MSEVRTGQRFPMALAVKIKNGKSGRKGSATTDNLSAAGVFITTDLPFRKGTKVNFEITLPSSIVGSSNDVNMNCDGRVVRIDSPKNGKKRGVACVIDRYHFVPQRKSREAK